MHQTITKNGDRNTGEISSHRENAAQAISAFQNLALEVDEKQAKEAYIKLLVGRGFSKSQMLYYDKTVRIPNRKVRDPRELSVENAVETRHP